MARGKAKSGKAAPTLGYSARFAEQFILGPELGRGGNGIVRAATEKATGRTLAVKSIPKVLNDPGASERKKAEQIPYIQREVEVLLALRGALSVANLEEVFEDATHVHLVLELCGGGELLARARGSRHYSERTAASFLRAVLRTVALCHAQRIIHRDIKPENFLLLSEDDSAPLKAIDFGLAVFFDPGQLPVQGLNPEGTPWYLAPECCRAKWWPVSDVWAVGVMACYLMTGAYPFLDRVSPKMPDLVRTLRSICFDELDLGRKEFDGLSEGAKAFIAALLVKDPQQRPSAEEALRHPFLRGTRRDRTAGTPLDRTVVQRIQRFAQSSLFKRTVLEHIAADLLAMHFAPGDASSHGASVFQDRSVKGGMAFAAARAERGAAGGLHARSPSAASLPPDGSAHGGVGGSRHRTLKGVASAALAVARLEASVRGGTAGLQRSASAASLAATASMYLPVATPYSQRLAKLFDQLHLQPGQQINRAQLQRALEEIGYHLREDEVGELFGVVDVDHSGQLSRAELAAGLIDWKAFQDTYKDRWLECARRAFAELDADGDGALGADEIAAAFGSHLSPYEVDAAVHHALLEATASAGAAPPPTPNPAALPPSPFASSDGDGGPAVPRPIDFDRFLSMLRAPSGADDLDLFEDRLSNHTSRRPSLWADDLQRVDTPQAAVPGKPPSRAPRGAAPAARPAAPGGGQGCCTVS